MLRPTVAKRYLIIYKLLNKFFMKFFSIVRAACQTQAYFNVTAHNLKLK